ncbi:hypothetical protein HERIO_403 [Hepatospora eriocheir]|uniref:Uncharacterized protein n=1 Tax=Hepatospora eriocheir TaxID=1081669 RepID=A0A1X0QDE9_9MICR|nr:hypothetical protein HERIO_403 [Hepatospora eriocheir]
MNDDDFLNSVVTDINDIELFDELFSNEINNSFVDFLNDSFLNTQQDLINTLITEYDFISDVTSIKKENNDVLSFNEKDVISGNNNDLIIKDFNRKDLKEEDFFSEEINDKENLTNKELINENLLITGFKTGNNKKIKIKEENINQSLFLEGDNKMKVVKDTEGNFQVNVKDNQQKGLPMRRYNCPQKGHKIAKVYSNIKMVDIFKKCCEIFKNCSKKWVKIQFKWVWLHLLLNPINNTEFLESEVINLM